ncbi:MAG: hypothetical protein RLZ39_790, partial [Bacteroidota bacterium]
MIFKFRFVVYFLFTLFFLGFAHNLLAQGFHFPIREQSSGVLRSSELKGMFTGFSYPSSALLYVSNDQRSVQLGSAGTFSSNVQ